MAQRRPFHAAFVLLTATCTAWQLYFTANHVSVFLGLTVPHRRAANKLRLAASASAEEDVWREAYDAEMERNKLLREQLSALQIDADGQEMPEACSVDWKDSYEQVAACNAELEDSLRRGGGLQAGGRTQTVEQTAALEPLVFEVPLPAQDTTERLELVRYHTDGRDVAFYSIQASLPLGLQMAKCNSGPLKGAFLVEEVLEGAGQENGVAAGDLLHAVTVVMDRANLGIKTEDFVSNVVGGMGRWRQTIMDTSFINTVDDLVVQMQSNNAMGSDMELVLVFERDLTSSQPPPNVLEPVASQ
mmetsp:Transcript_42127/g.98254  ORF Transcript_42127/g.98254 Transcript_42127/m.98254 type:complete len:302 (-) Transcript_42127:44-949(-)